MRAEMTFRGGIGLGVKIDRVVWAGLHAGFATDANGGIEFNNAVVALIHRADRTNPHTRRVGTVVATCHLKATAYIRESSRLGVFNPRAIRAQRHLIFRLARRTARVTANALALINQKSVIGHEYLVKVERRKIHSTFFFGN
jgi:hypothetical protein